VTRRSFHEELAELHGNVLRMGTFVTEAIQKAVQSLARLDAALAREVIAGDDTVDQMMIDIEKRCLELLALQQPMASDLRSIGTALKIVTDLERIADHATDIARVTIRLEGEQLIKPLVDIPYMADLVQKMTKEALEAYVSRDIERVRRMVAMDDEVDAAYKRIFDELLEIMQKDPQTVRQATYLLQVGMFLERVGDHATNLGEWTIYLVTGELQDLNA
jgi:phosphate transport system protein